MASLVDTNVLVYCFDPRFPEKQRIARELLHGRLAAGEVALAHQVILEFVAAVSRPRRDLDGAPLLTLEQAYREAEELMLQFPILYPDQEVLTTALRGAAASSPGSMHTCGRTPKSTACRSSSPRTSRTAATMVP